jgi:hypothetical protein
VVKHKIHQLTKGKNISKRKTQKRETKKVLKPLKTPKRSSKKKKSHPFIKI